MMDRAFSVVLNHDLSLHALSQLQSEGHSVIRSAHAGNLQPANLVALDRGVTFLLHECLSSDEPNYRPGHRVIAGELQPLAHSIDERIALWQSCNGHASDSFLSPIHVHLRAITSAWPNARSLSDFLLAIGQDILDPLLARFLEVDPDVAHAFIDEDGHKTPVQALDPADVKRMLAGHFRMVSDSIHRGRRPSATVIPDTAALIVLSTIAGLLQPDSIYQRRPTVTAEVYHLAGVQMIQYLLHNPNVSEPYLERIERLYREAREIVPALPPRVVFHLVPTGHFTRLVTSGGSTKLARALALARTYRETKAAMEAETKQRLAPYQAELEAIDSLEAMERFIASLAMTAEERQRKRLTPTEYVRDSQRFEKRLIGWIASKMTSELHGRLQDLSREMNQLKHEGAVSPRAVTQYDAIPDELVPDCAASLSPGELAELFETIAKS